MSDDRVTAAETYHRDCIRYNQTGRPDPVVELAEDPSSWPYTDVNGPPWPDPQHDQRQGYSADEVTLADFTIAPREHLCPECWQIHRPEVECP